MIFVKGRDGLIGDGGGVSDVMVVVVVVVVVAAVAVVCVGIGIGVGVGERSLLLSLLLLLVLLLILILSLLDLPFCEEEGNNCLRRDIEWSRSVLTVPGLVIRRFCVRSV